VLLSVPRVLVIFRTPGFLPRKFVFVIVHFRIINYLTYVGHAHDLSSALIFDVRNIITYSQYNFALPRIAVYQSNIVLYYNLIQ